MGCMYAKDLHCGFQTWERGGGGGVFDQCLGIGVPLRYVKMR